MTEEACITYCSNEGYIYAGAEYSNECCKSPDPIIDIHTDSYLQSVATPSRPPRLLLQPQNVVWRVLEIRLKRVVGLTD